MADFNVADGSVATILKEGSPMSLLKGYQRNTWFYAPRAARITRSDDGRPHFVVARNRVHLPGGGGFETVGGVFAAQLELAVPLPNQQEQDEWTEHIGSSSSIFPVGGGSFRFQPMRLRSGKMSILGVDQYVTDPAALIDVPIGASSTIPVSLELNKLGADTFAFALNSSDFALLPLTVYMSFSYDMVVPKCHYKITAHNRKVYDYFSYNVKARASYWGWVGAQTDIQRTREELVSSGAIKIEQISPPEGLDNERIKELERSLIDTWTKNVLAQIAEKPEMNPADAPKPGGFFGGISVSMKSYHQVQDLQLSAEYNYSQLSEEPYSMSFVFGPQFAELDPSEFLIDVIDDNKLPIVINLTKDERIYRYSGQYGYRKEDGTLVAHAITDVPGNQGGVLTGNIQFSPSEPMPEKTETQLSVDWEDTNWEDRIEKHVLANGESGAAFQYSPGNNISRILLITDLELLEPGAISVITWKTSMPPFEGNPVKVYSGALYTLGQGGSGQVKAETIEFPYFKGTEEQSKLLWEVQITLPNGTVHTKSGEQPAAQSALPFLRAVLTAESDIARVSGALQQSMLMKR
jgi:hypothetical protein